MEYKDMSLQQLRVLLKAECAIYNVTDNPSVWHRNHIAKLTAIVKEREMDIPQIRKNAYIEKEIDTKLALIVVAIGAIIFFAALACLSI